MRVSAASAGLLAASMLIRLYAQTYSVFGLDEPVTWDLLWLTGWESRWGSRWRPQALVAAVAVAVAIAGVMRERPWGGLMAGPVVALAVVVPMTGHAMAHPGGVALAWSLQAGHGLAAGAWLGTLAALLMAFVALRRQAGVASDEAIRAIVDAFSRLAIGAVALVLVTGVGSTLLSVHTLADLWRTQWGRVLALKVGLVLATGAVGAYNWWRLRPTLGSGEASGRLLRSGGVELGLAGLLLVVTSVLVHLPTPHG